jgi:hypothetical protein
VTPLAASADGHALAAQYEALRQEVVDKNGCRYVARGLALLMHKGMAAWMRGIEEESSPVAAVAPTSAGDRLPEGIERGLIDIVAAMALATATTTATAAGVT